MTASMAGIAPVVTSLAAAQGASDSGALQEIVVTAQKRAQNLQDVGASITALGAQNLAMLGQQDVTALVRQVPSLQVNSYNPTVVIFNIRGVSQNALGDSQEAPIAFYNDEVYISSLGAISGQVFDLERVEVLRGPQGTLFGRNATGGLVQVITAKPTRTLEGYAGATAGSYGQFSSEGAISGPLADSMRARLAFTTNRTDGFIKRAAIRDGGAVDFYAMRGQLEMDVAERGTLRLKAEYLRNDKETAGNTIVPAGVTADGLGFRLAPTQDFWGTGGNGRLPFPCPGCDGLGFRPDPDPLRSGANYEGAFDRKYWNLTLRYDHDLDFAKLTSISNYQHLDKIFGLDSDGSPVPAFDTNLDQRMHQLSQELRLSGASDTLNWVAGAYGLDIRSHALERVGTPSTVPADAAFFVNTDGLYKTASGAIFGQLEYKLSAAFTIIAGARYSADRKTLGYTNSLNGLPPFAFDRQTFPDLAKQRFSSWSGKLELDYKPYDDGMLYASINRGTKSGGFQPPVFPPVIATTIPFDQEVLTNYEAGYKLRLLEDKVSFNGAVFHYVYDNYQAYSFIGLSTFISNHPANVSGVELELSARPVRNLQFNVFAANLFEAEVRDISLPSGRATHTRIPQTPKWSLGGSASYTVATRFGPLLFATNWKYDGKQNFNTFNAPIDDEPARLVGDVRVSFTTANEHWETSFFINNVTDRRYRIFDNDIASVLGFGSSVYEKPRWFGASLKYSFGS